MATLCNRIWRSTYKDSVTLMRMSLAASALPRVRRAAVMMGTAQNHHYLTEAGLYTPELDAASPHDLVAVVDAEDEEAAASAMATVAGFLETPESTARQSGAAQRPRTYRQALEVQTDANLALVSIPGEYAAAEALRALKRGLNVMIFSNHVPVEQEVELKTLAVQRGLLVMGPDCGTAIIGGQPLAFANKVRSGNIGVIGASGTGIQQVTTLIDRLGAGVSHAIGVGGRDLWEAVGGLSMLQAIDLLLADEQTQVLVLLSKPCAPAVAARILERVRGTRIPMVVNFLGGDPAPVAASGAIPAVTLEEAAVQAVRLASNKDICAPVPTPEDLQRAAGIRLTPEQRYIRGLFAGGTLAYEAMCVLASESMTLHSNIPLDHAERLADVELSIGHTVIDFGDEKFTSGRPHPMIDSRLRAERIRQEALDSEVAVLLLDVILGYGSQSNPAASLVPAITAARAQAAAAGRDLAVVIYVCGTAADPQGLAAQEAALRAAGAIVCPTGAGAARLALALAQRELTHGMKGDELVG